MKQKHSHYRDFSADRGFPPSCCTRKHKKIRLRTIFFRSLLVSQLTLGDQ